MKTSLSEILCARHNDAEEACYAEQAKRLERAVSKLPSIPKELVSHFLTGPVTGEAIEAAGAAFKKALIEAALTRS